MADMDKILRPMITLAAMSLQVLILFYLCGYYVLSYPYCGPNQRILGTGWQYSLDTPLMEIESGIRGNGFSVGWRS